MENEITLAEGKQKPVDHHRLTGFLFFVVAAEGLEPPTHGL